MTSPPTPSPRQKRRILAVIAVLVLGVGGWLLYPRTDPRFVGDWEFIDANETTSSFCLELNRWGRARLYEPGTEFSMLTSWSVADGKFRIGNEPDGLMKRILETLEEQLSNLTGNDYMFSSREVISIAEVTTDEVHLYDEVSTTNKAGQSTVERQKFRMVRRKK